MSSRECLRITTAEYKIIFTHDDRMKFMLGLGFIINIVMFLITMLMLIPFSSLISVIIFFGYSFIHLFGWFCAFMGLAKEEDSFTRNILRTIFWEVVVLNHFWLKFIKPIIPAIHKI